MNFLKFILFALIFNLIKTNAFLSIKRSLGVGMAGRRTFCFIYTILQEVLDPFFDHINPGDSDVLYIPPSNILA